MVLDEKALNNLESAMKSFEISSNAKRKKQIASASSALTIGVILGLLQAAFLITAARPLLGFMGVEHVRNPPLSCFPASLFFDDLSMS